MPNLQLKWEQLNPIFSNSILVIVLSPSWVYYWSFTSNNVLVPELSQTGSAQNYFFFLIDSYLYNFHFKSSVWFSISNSKISLLVPLSFDSPVDAEVYLIFSSSQRVDYITDRQKKATTYKWSVLRHLVYPDYISAHDMTEY